MFNQDLNNAIVTLSTNIVDTEAGSIDLGLAGYVGKIPGSVHHLVKASLIDGIFTLDNLSQWTCANIEMVKNWKADDELLITQNQAFLSSYRFALVNPRLQKAVPISLFREPLPIDHKMFFVLNIDLANDVITLSNGSSLTEGVEYSVYGSDHGTLRKFSENDRVILGFNSSDRLDSTNLDLYKAYILINTTCNSYVRANPVGWH